METIFHKEKGSQDFGVVVVRGNFTANGASAIDNTKNVGKGWTVAYTSTGTYTITFTNWTGSPTLISWALGLGTTATNHDFTLQKGTYSASAGTMTVRAMVGTTATDVNANDLICFEFNFTDSASA